MLIYEEIKHEEDWKNLFRRKKEIKRIKNTLSLKSQKLFKVTMLDDIDNSFQGVSIIGVSNRHWGVCAFRTTKEYRHIFMNVLFENVPWYLFDNELEFD